MSGPATGLRGAWQEHDIVFVPTGEHTLVWAGRSRRRGEARRLQAESGRDATHWQSGSDAISINVYAAPYKTEICVSPALCEARSPKRFAVSRRTENSRRRHSPSRTRKPSGRESFEVPVDYHSLPKASGPVDIQRQTGQHSSRMDYHAQARHAVMAANSGEVVLARAALLRGQLRHHRPRPAIP